MAAFSSCTTLYKSGQTPDDVYYSPVRTVGEEKTVATREEVRTYDVYEDRTIRLGIIDPRWRYFDNDYSYSPYYYGYNNGYYYNPYFYPYPVYPAYGPAFSIISNPKNTTPRMANLAAYVTPQAVKTQGYTKQGSTIPVRSYNNSNRTSAVGNVIRQIITPSNNTNNYNNSNTNTNTSNNSTRTYTPAPSTSSSSSSSSGSSSSGSGGVSRPPRNGGN